MGKKRNVILGGIFAALLLTACGGETDEIQMVEREDITVPSQASERAESSGPAQDEEQETKEETTPSVEEEASTKKPEGGAENAFPQPAAVRIETDKKEYKDGDRIILVTNYDNVAVSIEGNEAAAQAIMAEFAKRKQAFEEGLALEETLEMARENPVVDGSLYYSEERWYTVERNDGRVLSFSTMWDAYEGGAHGQYMIYGLNFDGRTGQLLEIGDIAQDLDAFQEICVQEMTRQCEDLKAQGMLFEDDILEAVPGGLQGILEGKMEGEEWYFTKEGIRFVSNIYEIAPYAAGSIDFDIPYEMVNEALKEEYRG